jgi:hypothetical protein
VAKIFPPVRTECRIAKKLMVELRGFQNAANEIASTTNVSPQGARVLTKHSWAPYQDVCVRAVPGNFSLWAHVIYCRPLPDSSFFIGLRLLQPSENWPARSESSPLPLSH